ncbi:MAG: hypothetical protein A2103_01100 [Gammaproteobacteria bacterium GWF2_41_13]|nr:MAG: hypothetical protein A2103_01100 [Gammaproteobacteria bacterium GWF2_41_13]
MKICLFCQSRFDSELWQCPVCGFTPRCYAGRYIFSPILAEENDSFPVALFEDLTKLENKNFWFRSRNKLILWALKKYFSHMNHFFEIGCGTGYVLSAIEQFFPGLTLTGSDIYLKGLEFASKRLKKVELFQMDARNIPFLNEFDVIGAFDVLEHVDDDERVLSQMYQAVKQGGGVILTVPQHQCLWGSMDEISCHKRRYSKKDLINKCEKAGFTIHKITSFVSILFPIMWISRLKKSNKDLKDDLSLNKFFNFTFDQAVGLDRLLIKMGFDLPFGGSLLVVAKKEN